jgi:phosphate transport system substrate-binding protein
VTTLAHPIRTRLVIALVVIGVAAALLLQATRPSGATPARINGSGSTYVALAMQQWVADAQTSGLSVNYLPTGSPDGLTSFGNGLIDFAGTEAEFSALSGGGGGPSRGYQYVPDVAGAIAVMYNVQDKAGNKVDYLHLSRRTIARIFTGSITNWSDQAISDDNKGLQLPDKPITVVYRSGQSGTTALFYDFVQNVAPDVFNPWAAKYGLPTHYRIIQLDGTPNFAPNTLALNGSDQIAQFVAGTGGAWSIAYDEFGYAKTYGAPAAWVQNAAGEFVQPYAANISAALESATLRPDLSQELSGVYNSANPAAYPISAYSYLVAQCAPTGDRPSCKGAYANTGVTETLAKWMRYIACEGQINMARIGYSPLPPNLSQEIANSIARLQGGSPEILNQGNCSNPRFSGSLGSDAQSPGDPLANVASLGGGGGGDTTQAAGGTEAATQAATQAGAAIGAASGKAGAVKKSAGGGSTDYRALAPVVYRRGGDVPVTPPWPLIAFVAVLAVPPLVIALRRRRWRRASEMT